MKEWSMPQAINTCISSALLHVYFRLGAFSAVAKGFYGVFRVVVPLGASGGNMVLAAQNRSKIGK
jgi:hypothetical protein